MWKIIALEFDQNDSVYSWVRIELGTEMMFNFFFFHLLTNPAVGPIENSQFQWEKLITKINCTPYCMISILIIYFLFPFCIKGNDLFEN